jgi:hypothetical protein
VRVPRTLTAERFAFPSAVGVVVRADVTGPLKPERLLEIVTALASSKTVILTGSTGPRAMAAVLGDLVDGAERPSIADGDPNAVENNRPMTIATVTAMTCWPLEPVVQGDSTHRLLEGLCRLSGVPLTGMIGRLGDGLLVEASGYPGTARYVLDRAIASSSPSQSDRPDNAYRLSCYHLNQTLAALYASALLDTARWASTFQVASLSENVRDSLTPVVNILGLLYGKVPDMYATEFVRRQIAGSGLVPVIGNLRITLGVGGSLK